jgi:hypothetical protein
MILVASLAKDGHAIIHVIVRWRIYAGDLDSVISTGLKCELT